MTHGPPLREGCSCVHCSPHREAGLACATWTGWTTRSCSPSSPRPAGPPSPAAADHDSADDFAQEAMTRVLAAGDRPGERGLASVRGRGGRQPDGQRRSAGRPRPAGRSTCCGRARRPTTRHTPSSRPSRQRPYAPRWRDCRRPSRTSSCATTAARRPPSWPRPPGPPPARSPPDWPAPGPGCASTYVLALRNVTLPSDTCRRVLLAISAGDVRRQQALDTSAGTSAGCPVCPPPGGSTRTPAQRTRRHRRRALGLLGAAGGPHPRGGPQQSGAEQRHRGHRHRGRRRRRGVRVRIRRGAPRGQPSPRRPVTSAAAPDPVGLP